MNTELEANWIAIAQTYATLSAGYRQALATAGAFAGWKTLERKAQEYEGLAEAALKQAGVVR